MGVEIAEDEMAMLQLNLREKWKNKNHSAGHISNEEAEELILFLQKNLEAK